MKQRVLLVTKFYYRRGGDCIVALNQQELLTAMGHEVAVFAMNFSENLPSQWQEFWPEEVSFGGGIKNKLKAVGRTLGHGDVVAAFKRMLDEFRPDVVHLHNIHSYLSPVVAKIASERGIRVVWTMHDYKLVCPGYSCLRDGRPCELCFTSKRNVLSKRCMKGSLAASAIAYLEALKWNPRRLQRYTSTFICPSRFMAEKMAQGGFSKEKLATVCNFIPPAQIELFKAIDPTAERQPYYCYVGRLSAEKGVATLIEAASRLPYTLKVAGDGPLMAELRERYGRCPNIEFLGMQSAEQVRQLLSEARFSVMPSECYENNPLGVIESLCAGTPVVGAQIGGIPELITEGRGFTFESGNALSLTDAITKAWTATFDYAAIQRRALIDFSPATHYALLQSIYQ